MADTIPDVQAPAGSYASLNALTGIASGTALVITNKSQETVRVQVAAAMPAATSTDGMIIYPGDPVTSTVFINVGEAEVWARSVNDRSASISVQDHS